VVDYPLGERFAPQRWQDLVGRDSIIERLQELRRVAHAEDRCIESLLFFGDTGLGKASLARVLANEAGIALKTREVQAIETGADIAGVLTAIERGDLLLIEEIHRMSASAQSVFASAIQKFSIDLQIDSGRYARSVPLVLPQFTLIGTTNDPSALTEQLQDAFLVKCRFAQLTIDEIAQILGNQASKWDLGLDKEAALRIAEHSGGKPAVAYRLLDWVARYCHATQRVKVNEEATIAALWVLGYVEANA